MAAAGALARFAARKARSGALKEFMKNIPRQLKGLVTQKAPAAISKGLAKTKDIAKRPHKYIWESLAPAQTAKVLKGAAQDPAGALYRGFWQKSSPLDRLLLAGFTLPQLAKIKGMEPGKERSEAIGGLVGGTSGWLMSGKLPLLSSMLMWGGAEAAGSKAGKLYGKLRHGKKKPDEEPPAVTNKVIKTASATDLVMFVREAARIAKEGTDE